MTDYYGYSFHFCVLIKHFTEKEYLPNLADANRNDAVALISANPRKYQ